jgi:undecaprenyl diphosphate synthase
MDVPYHIAVIMDGNGRWAKKRGLPRTAGHHKGMERVKEVVKEAKQSGVKVLTVFAFSTENWNRPQQEIKVLLTYLNNFLNSYKTELMKEDIRFRVIGRRSKFDAKVVDKIEKLETATKENKSFTFIVALDYGGRWDIVNAAKKMAEASCKGGFSEDLFNEAAFADCLCLEGISDPELLIRTSGEQRISNFLLWNAAYSEFYFTETLWPDFNKDRFQEALKIYKRRKRRFGGIDE